MLLILSWLLLGSLNCVSQSNIKDTTINFEGKHLFSFVHLTDIHISTADWNQHWHLLFKLFSGKFENWKDNFCAAADEINQLNPAFVFITGDLVMGGSNGGANDEFMNAKNYITKLNVPFYFIPGDHDLGVSALAAGIAKKEPIERYENIFGSSYFSVDYDSIHFVGLNSSLFDDGLENEKNAQLEWLKNDLEKNKRKRIFLFAHKSGILKKSFPIVKNYRIEALFVGHVHRNNEKEKNGIKIITTKATSYGWGAPGYRIVDVYESGIQTKEIKLNK